MADSTYTVIHYDARLKLWQAASQSLPQVAILAADPEEARERFEAAHPNRAVWHVEWTNPKTGELYWE